ncbi:Uncharacterized protein PRO82_001109 [Candidatus Protochlamydia amoebophila]|jgi:hypothetical protein|uniref:DUF7706 family protein n=1 Tax=Bacteria TaxID=2 RepID=UPI0010E087CE|nr:MULTISPECIES: hypothetical protein [Bacteria]MCP4385444.1 hypothetical protein [Hyphomicrobiales bacterium]RYF11651.1 MAG: hypothetical protein EOO77_18925 [Oxalobacteraceae bacterium]MBS4163803.1 Uncharacterized protein [Candidatus Protochlamydia amoebophila]MCP4031182.1 hypothetical protein [Herbaspirillum sp.]MCP4557323.1 hypothetical protein [Herbaspirillum sp.]
MVVELELSEDEAWALAEFVKRVTWSEMRACAVDDDEAYMIRSAVLAVGEALASQGIAPR